MSINGTAQSRTHGLAHELTAIGSTALTHNLRGGITQDNRGVQYSYDFDSVLNQAVVPASVPGTVAGTHTYQYDALGRRVAKTVGANTTVYVSRSYGSRPNRMGRELAEYPLGTPAASSSAKYAYGAYVDDALMLVDRTVAGTVAAGTDERLYLHADRRASVTGLSNTAGAVVERYAYTPYGETSVHDAGGTVISTGTAYGQLLGYTGRRLDPELATYHFRARTFQPNLGRFLSRDPLMYPDGPNAYAGWHGLRRRDPSGMWNWDGDWISHGLGGYLGYRGPEAVEAAGESYLQNAGNAHKGLEGLSNVPGAGYLADGVDQTLGMIEGPLVNQAAKQNANPVLCGFVDGIGDAVAVKDLVKAGKGLGKLATTTPGPTGKTYQTYTKKHPETGEVYSGRASGTGTPQQNIKKRDSGHHMNAEGYGPAQLDKSSPNPDAIRGREQQLIDANGGAKSQGGTSGNQINGISPRNKQKREKYLDAAEKEFCPQGE